MSRLDSQSLERKEWIASAIGYLFSVGAVDEHEIFTTGFAWGIAESLWYHSRDEGGEMMYTPEEAVDEEMSYWGE